LEQLLLLLLLQTTNLNLEHETRTNVAGGLRRLIDLVSESPLGVSEKPLAETQAHPYVSRYVYFGKAVNQRTPAGNSPLEVKEACQARFSRQVFKRI